MADLTARVHRRRKISAVLLSTLLAATPLLVAGVPGPAGADQVATLRAQAAAIAQRLIEGQLQVDAYQQQYSVVSARVAADNQAIAQTGQEIGQDQQQISARVAMVRLQAVRSYVDYGTGSGSTTAALFGGSQVHAQAASEYVAIAVGNITTAVDQLHAAQAVLQGHQAALRQQRDRDRSDQASQATALGQADSSTAQLEALHGQVTGQLATAVAAQAAAQDQAAAAAVAAAQRQGSPTTPVARPVSTVPAGATAGTATPAPVVPPAGSGSNLPDPALNPFLQCVVQAESGGNYSINTGNGYYGAFQFSQSTWNLAAQDAGLSYLVGVVPSSATKAEQDTVAVALYALDGNQPWLGDRCS